MKRIIAAIALFLALAVPVSAAALAGTITITGRTAATVSVHAEETSGDTVRLTLEHYCYQGPFAQTGSTYAGMESVTFTGSVDATFSVAPRKVKGQIVTPTDCWAYLVYKTPSQTEVILAGIITLP